MPYLSWSSQHSSEHSNSFWKMLWHLEIDATTPVVQEEWGLCPECRETHWSLVLFCYFYVKPTDPFPLSFSSFLPPTLLPFFLPFISFFSLPPIHPISLLPNLLSSLCRFEIGLVSVAKAGFELLDLCYLPTSDSMVAGTIGMCHWPSFPWETVTFLVIAESNEGIRNRSSGLGRLGKVVYSRNRHSQSWVWTTSMSIPQKWRQTM